MIDTKTKEASMIDRLFSVGAHFGYRKSKRHPSTAPYIFGVKNKTEVFDLEKTSALLEEAKAVMEGWGTERKQVLIVGGKNEARRAVETIANRLDMPYVATRWIGGTITNFPEIKQRLARLDTLKDQREKGELQKRYTKKERLMIDREISDLEKRFGGVMRMKDKLPDAMVIVDTRAEDTAVREARTKKIPFIGFGNSDCDAGIPTYAIVGNDSSARSIELVLGELASAYERGISNAPAKQAMPGVEGASASGVKE